MSFWDSLSNYVNPITRYNSIKDSHRKLSSAVKQRTAEGKIANPFQFIQNGDTLTYWPTGDKYTFDNPGVHKSASGSTHGGAGRSFNVTSGKSALDSSGSNVANTLKDSLNGLLSTFSDSANTISSALSTSALDYSKQVADEANAWTASQNALNREFQQASAEREMLFNRAEAEKAREFSERMSNTQYQRAVADLRAAGLSPLLAYSSLNGSVPASSVASGASASGSVGSVTAPNVSSAKNSDISSIKSLAPVMVVSMVNSAFDLIKKVFK